MAASCDTKQRHATREEALAHVKSLLWRNVVAGTPDRSAGLAPYPCERHACWHVGHQESMPLVWHYTVGAYLERILKTDALRVPRTWDRRRHHGLGGRARAQRIEPKPLLWFTRNSEWEYSVRKLRLDRYGDRSMFRSMQEVLGEGLCRFGVSAAYAKLRWSDYLVWNRIPPAQRDIMARYGNPTEWLATDEDVPLDVVRAIEVYYAGAWTAAADVSDEDFDRYLAGRSEAYRAANVSLRGKLPALVLGTAALTEAESILFADIKALCRGQAVSWQKAIRGKNERPDDQQSTVNDRATLSQ
jgi:hypothetical protein